MQTDDTLFALILMMDSARQRTDNEAEQNNG